MTNLLKPDRARSSDVLRAIGYLNMAIWAVLFFFFPPNAFVSELAAISRLLWLSFAFIGAVMAIVGALTRVDIKLEFPGLLMAMIGPVFYTLSQFYLANVPTPGVDPTQRIALVAYALIPVTLLLPRTSDLLREKNRLKGRAE